MIFAITSENIEDVCIPLAWEGEQSVAISGYSCVYATESIIPRYLAYSATAQDFQISKRKVAKGTKVIEAAPAAIYGLMAVSMPAMLLFTLQFSLLEARLRLIRATLTSCLSRFPLHRIPLCRERLLCLGAHCRLFKGFCRLTSAPLGVLRGLARLGRLATEERELLPFACNESQDLLIGRLRAEDDAGDAVPSVLDACFCILPSRFRIFN